MVTLRAKEKRHAPAIMIRSRILNTDILKMVRFLSEWKHRQIFSADNLAVW
jgi:hypothetical protein